VLKAARSSAKRDVIAVVQPHRYSRLHDLFDDFSACFNDADTVIVAPVYAAGEQAIAGVTHEELVNRIRARGHRDARILDKPEDLPALIASRAATGDYVVCLGAGNITQWAATLPAELGALIGKEPE
jgi:UDP-N-acetylmuramate--alanine ligase